jgi:NAD(P)-dependent dehydrogenase (short-subunit alcohol dehydrogenase family)
MKKQVVIIGASRGIGGAVAKHFAEKLQKKIMACFLFPEANQLREIGFEQTFLLQRG